MELNLQAAARGQTAASHMKRYFVIVASAAVLATFFLCALYGPWSLMYRPVNEVRAAREIDGKMVIAVFAPVSFSSATLAAFAFVSPQVSHRAADGSQWAGSPFAVLLC